MGCDKVSITLRNHEHYNTKNEVLEEIENNKRLIEQYKQKLFGMICGNIKDLFNITDEENNLINPIDIATIEFNKIFGFEDYDDYSLTYLIEHNIELQYIAEHWEDRWDEVTGYGLNNND